jgi:hypothetical protein
VLKTPYLPSALTQCHTETCLENLRLLQTEPQVLQFAGAPLLLSNVQELSLLRHQFYCARLEPLQIHLVGHGEVLRAFTASSLVYAFQVSIYCGHLFISIFQPQLSDSVHPVAGWSSNLGELRI